MKTRVHPDFTAGMFTSGERVQMVKVLRQCRADHDAITMEYPSHRPCQCDLCEDIKEMILRLERV